MKRLKNCDWYRSAIWKKKYASIAWQIENAIFTSDLLPLVYIPLFISFPFVFVLPVFLSWSLVRFSALPPSVYSWIFRFRERIDLQMVKLCDKWLCVCVCTIKSTRNLMYALWFHICANTVSQHCAVHSTLTYLNPLTDRIACMRFSYSITASILHSVSPLPVLLGMQTQELHALKSDSWFVNSLSSRRLPLPYMQSVLSDIVGEKSIERKKPHSQKCRRNGVQRTRTLSCMTIGDDLDAIWRLQLPHLIEMVWISM